MPTREAIVDSVIPHEVAKPIPTRVISTRSGPPVMKIAGETPENTRQQTTDRSEPAADSATPEESVKLSPQLSALARKEQAFRQRELVLKQREKDLESKLTKAEEFDQLQTKLTAKDFSGAEKLGLNYEEYTNYLLTKQAGEDPQVQAFKKLEDEILEMKKKQEEEAEQEFDSTVAAYKREITNLATSNPEFSSIKELKAEGHVLQLILDSWNEDKIEMTVEEACKEVENAIVEQGKKFSSLPKLKPQATAEDPKRTLPKPGVKTLTNQMQPSGQEPKSVKSLQQLSESERYAEARRRVLARRAQEGR